MTLKDISNGPDWVLWVAFSFLLIISIVLISGQGEKLIAGYNTASKEEKSKYNTKKLCRVVGAGILIISIVCHCFLGSNSDGLYCHNNFGKYNMQEIGVCELIVMGISRLLL